MAEGAEPEYVEAVRRELLATANRLGSGLWERGDDGRFKGRAERGGENGR